MTVESSPGNKHYWFFVEKALTAEQAKPIGDAMRKATRTDSGTGNICQPFRVAGTPNFPSKSKRERGRGVAATRVVDYQPSVLWTPEKLLAALPAPQEKQRKKEAPRDAEPGTLPASLLRQVQTDVAEGERSEKFFGIVAKLKKFWLPFYREGTLDKIVELFEQHPDGIASKYAGRIREEAERCYHKVDIHLDSLPVIIVREGEIPRVLSETADALRAKGVPLYARGGQVVMPHKEVFDAADGRKTGATVFTKVTIPGMTVEMAHAATFIEYRKIEGVVTPVYADPPTNIAQIMLSPNRFFTVPTVSGIITTPLIREDGSIFGDDRDAYDSGASEGRARGLCRCSLHDHTRLSDGRRTWSEAARELSPMVSDGSWSPDLAWRGRPRQIHGSGARRGPGVEGNSRVLRVWFDGARRLIQDQGNHPKRDRGGRRN
jgi:hypothetical protein